MICGFFQHGITDKFYFSTFIVEYLLFVLQMLLSLIPEPKSPYDYFRENDVSMMSL